MKLSELVAELDDVILPKFQAASDRNFVATVSCAVFARLAQASGIEIDMTPDEVMEHRFPGLRVVDRLSKEEKE